MQSFLLWSLFPFFSAADAVICHCCPPETLRDWNPPGCSTGALLVQHREASRLSPPAHPARAAACVPEGLSDVALGSLRSTPASASAHALHWPGWGSGWSVPAGPRSGVSRVWVSEVPSPLSSGYFTGTWMTCRYPGMSADPGDGAAVEEA